MEQRNNEGRIRIYKKITFGIAKHSKKETRMQRMSSECLIGDYIKTPVKEEFAALLGARIRAPRQPRSRSASIFT